ncbi:MmcQ/YjbR family DNA-binding protein [Oceanobacter mangrovi]|uniref:MmcQ/YjbR family DNA-binding protein n=1 Tax=Oceanobacter mangrovi TaxID=2862510 RepID=UPI001C8DDB58|nr:MmcQ/YjbR family DNA-binding protein [Oceanobacter mangrovi]
MYLAARPEAVEDYPFGPDARVFKIAGKMFALLMHRHGQDCVNLKCDPQEAIELRDVFAAVQPGYHMNKKHWNTVVLDGSLPQGEIERMIDNSYALVVKTLPKATRQGLEARHGRAIIYRTDC